jgi:hypothetical protein
MTQDISHCPIYASVLRQPPPISKGFALRHHNAVSCKEARQKILRNSAGSRYQYDAAVRFTGKFVAPSPTPHIQTP